MFGLVSSAILGIHSAIAEEATGEIEEVKVQQTNTTNNVFMSGSTADLMMMLKESQKDK